MVSHPIVNEPLDEPTSVEREFFIDNLLVRIHFIIEMIRWTGLAPWQFEFPFPGSVTSTLFPPQHCPSRRVHAGPCEGFSNRLRGTVKITVP